VKAGVAVIVPAHDAAAFLAAALRSALDQQPPPAEILVVDDGSTDGTHEVAGALGVRCVRQDRCGPGAARNRGIAETTAPLLAFLDADDWFAPGKLQRQAELLGGGDAPAACSDAFRVVGDVVEGTKNGGRDVPSAITMDHLMRGNPVICSTVLCRREAVLAAGGFDEDPVLVATEDYDLWLRLSRLGPLAYLPEPLAFYRVHPGSLSANERFLAGVDRIMEKVLEADRARPGLHGLARRRRAGVRLDLAWDLLRRGRPTDARRWLREARTLAGPSWKWLRMWLRCLLA
jgi:glycosyltransferase involved in cell wall biosynthesis